MLRMSNLSVFTMTAILLCGVSLKASVIVAGTNLDRTGFYFVADAAAPVGALSIEQLFSVSTPVDLTSLSINAASFSNQTLQVQLFSGEGFQSTSVLLQTFNLNVSGGFNGLLTGIPTITTTTSLHLGGGNYSLVLSDPGSSSDLIYLNAAIASNTPDGSLGGVQNSVGFSSPESIVFSLEGTVTPEPGTIWPCTLGLLIAGLWSIGRAKRKGVC